MRAAPEASNRTDTGGFQMIAQPARQGLVRQPVTALEPIAAKPRERQCSEFVRQQRGQATMAGTASRARPPVRAVTASARWRAIPVRESVEKQTALQRRPATSERRLSR